MKVIGHIDADCFYVSCERIRDPRLLGKPIGVLGNQGACVIARSYEIRPYGVKVGMPVWEAKKLCPEGVFIKRDFQWYALLSAAMQEVLKQFSDTVEYYSIDESFIDFGEYGGNLKELGEKMRDQMLKQVGMPTSVGISLSKTLAKLAAKKKKPFGVLALPEEDLVPFLVDTHVSDVPGIGEKLFKRLRTIGVETTADYVSKKPSLIKKLLHKPGEELWYELQGNAVFPVRSVRPVRKNISRGGSLWGHHRDAKYIWAFLIRNLERVADTLWHYEMETKAVVVILVSSDGRAFKSLQILPDYSYSYDKLLLAIKKGFVDIFRDGLSYCQSHIIAEDLKSIRAKQLNLFEAETQRQRDMVELKKTLNRKYGIFTIRSGATAFAPEIFKDSASHFEISDIKDKFCF